VNERDIACRELVEMVTDYLEAALDSDTTTRVEEHLVICEPCAVYIDQMRLTSEAVRAAETDAPSASERAALLVAFRDWSRR
jgi:predicted anti-sigma-YlaC factor YlaD